MRQLSYLSSGYVPRVSLLFVGRPIGLGGLEFRPASVPPRMRVITSHSTVRLLAETDLPDSDIRSISSGSEVVSLYRTCNYM